VGTHLPLLLLAGAVAGVVLGCLGAFVQGLVDDRVRGAADLERCVGAPVVAVLPRRAAGTSPATVFTRTPPAAEQEAYRRLRVHLEPLLTPTADTAGQHGRWGTVVLVTSPHGREGRTWTASNLAAALARSGSEVLLVDADMRHPALTEIFRSGYRPGLADLLTGEATTVDAAVPTGLPGLRLITAGSGTGGTDVIEASRLRRVCAELRAAADVVVIDAGPVLETADPVGFARVSDLVLVVADVRVSRRGEVRAAAAEVWSAGPRAVAGVVLRPVSRTWTQRLAETGRQWQPEAARQAPAPNAPNGQVAGHGAGGPFALLGAGLPGHAEGGLSEGRVSAGLPDMATPPADDRPPVAETSTSLESEVPLQPGAPEADTFDEAADGGTGSGHWEQASDSPASSQWVWVER
jgi:capsular exopolysaccharide synthesis family protein